MPNLQRRSMILVLILACAFGVQAEKKAETKAAAPVLIDVRSAFEFKEGHAKGAINIPHTEIAEKIGGVVKDKKAEIHLYCRSGGRAGRAEAALKELGYTKVTNKKSLDAVLAEQEGKE